jgi:adenine-specific DNA-methyltransferase
MLCYAKNKNKLKFNEQKLDPITNTKYNKTDKHELRRGKYTLRDLEFKGTYSKTLDYIITAPDGSTMKSGKIIGEPKTWRWSKEKLR